MCKLRQKKHAILYLTSPKCVQNTDSGPGPHPFAHLMPVGNDLIQNANIRKSPQCTRPRPTHRIFLEQRTKQRSSRYLE